jgi:hypothetical protein
MVPIDLMHNRKFRQEIICNKRKKPTKQRVDVTELALGLRVVSTLSNVQISTDLFGDDPHVQALALVPFVDILVRLLLEIRCLWFMLVLALFIP